MLPGPGIPLLLAGLLILGAEFTWAQSLLNVTKRKSAAVANAASGRLKRKKQDPGPADKSPQTGE